MDIFLRYSVFIVIIISFFCYLINCVYIFLNGFESKIVFHTIFYKYIYKFIFYHFLQSHTVGSVVVCVGSKELTVSKPLIYISYQYHIFANFFIFPTHAIDTSGVYFTTKRIEIFIRCSQ